jgi:two-component system sensor histidine kinase YesM
VLKINALCSLFVAAVVFLAGFIADKIASPMRMLSRRMRDYRVGDAPAIVEEGRTEEIREIYAAYHNMSVHINELFGRLKQEQATKEKYYYESLRSRMSPHFLFNTLTSIRWMAIIRKADNIRESIDSLATILKYSMTGDDEMVALSQELDVVRRYCYIQNVRFGNGCDLVTDVSPEAERCHVIKFILQPTVENCFKHAFDADTQDGIITINGRVREDCLLLSVRDNGKGFSERSIREFQATRSPRSPKNEGGGIGFNIIDERIRVSFGEGYGIELSNNDRGGARVEYRLPAIAPATDRGHEKDPHC